MPVLNRRTGRLRMLFQHLEVGAAGVGEEQQHQADLGDPEKHFAVDLAGPEFGRTEEHDHPRGGKHNRRGHDRPVQAPGNQAVEKGQNDKSNDQSHPAFSFISTPGDRMI